MDSILPCWKYAAKRCIYWSYAESLQFPHQRNCCTRCQSAPQYRQVFLGRRGGEMLVHRVSPESSSTKLSKPMERTIDRPSLTTKSNDRRPSPRTRTCWRINTKLTNGFGIGGERRKVFPTCFSSPAAFRNQSRALWALSWFPEW